MPKDQKLDAHLCSDRSESSLYSLVPLTHVIVSVDIISVSTILITLIIMHIRAIFILLHLSHVNLHIYAGLLCENISSSFLNLLSISYCWNIRAIYWQYFEILNVNIVNRWLWYSNSNWYLKHTWLILRYSYIAA